MWITATDPFSREANYVNNVGRRLRGTDGSTVVEGFWCAADPDNDRVSLDRRVTGESHMGDYVGHTWESWVAEPDAPATWSPVTLAEISPGDRIRATRLDNAARRTTGTVSRVVMADQTFEGPRVYFQPGAVIENAALTRVGQEETSVLDQFRSYERESAGADVPWVLFSWEDHTPQPGDPIKWSGYQAADSARDDSGGEGTFLTVNDYDGVNVQATSPEARPFRGLSKDNRLWYRRDSGTPSEGASPVSDSPRQWEAVTASDLSSGDLVRLSVSGAFTQFPDVLTGTVVRVNMAAPSVDIRLTIGGGSWQVGEMRRSLSILPATRRVERAVADAVAPTSGSPTWQTLPTAWGTADARRVLPLQTHIRYRQDGNPRNRLIDGWVTGYGTAGYDFTVTGTEGSRREQYGVNFRWEPQVMAGPDLAATIAAIEAARPVYTWSAIESRAVLVPGMVIRADDMDGYRNAIGVVARVYSEAESTTTWGTARLEGDRHVSFRNPSRDNVQVDLSTAPVAWGSADVGWATVDRRRIPLGSKVRSLDAPWSSVGALESLDQTSGVARIAIEGAPSVAANVRAVIQVWNDGSPVAQTAGLLSNPDHLTLAGLKAAVFEFAKSEGDMFGQGSNCNAGTNEFLRAIGLPGQRWAPLVDESREIDAFLRQVQEYLSRDSIGISREKADSYLAMWGLPKAPRRRRVNIYATLDGDTTDAQIIERLPRVIRDATDVRVFEA